MSVSLLCIPTCIVSLAGEGSDITRGWLVSVWLGAVPGTLRTTDLTVCPLRREPELPCVEAKGKPFYGLAADPMKPGCTNAGRENDLSHVMQAELSQSKA